jgi:hypothetical protein
MVHVASVLFVVALVAVHLTVPDALPRPLSTFRDGPWSWAGYVLFALLFGMGAGHVALYARARQFGGMVVPLVCLVLLGFVALTPSFDGVHIAASLALLGLVFVYYAVRLYRVSSPWLLAHLAAPVALAAAAVPVLSYGVVQKGLILYFVFAVNVDCLLMTGRLWLPGPEDFERPKKKGEKRYSYRPKVIYRRYDDDPRKGADGGK